MTTAVPTSDPEIAAPGHNRRVCSATLYDDSIDEITFDENGLSNIARDSQWRLANEVYRGAEGEQRLAQWAEHIRKAGRGKDYDCIIGLSGGVDSSVVAARVVDLGLRPLAIHLDNGWNTDTAVGNIERIVKKLGIDLMTYVINWEDIRDLQRAYIKASVLDLECVSDHAINTVLYRTAFKHKIGFVIHGGNVVTESSMPSSWGYDKRDGRNVIGIHRRFGERKLTNYPYMQPHQFFRYLFLGNIKAFAILNYLDFNKKAGIAELQQRFDWRPYPRKHGENRFTRFYQEYYLPRKFGIDKRIAHFSSLMLSGELTREEAQHLVAQPLYTGNEEAEELTFVAKKLGFTEDELMRLVDAPPRRHTDFPNAAWMFDHKNPLVQFARYLAKGEFSLKGLSQIRTAAAQK